MSHVRLFILQALLVLVIGVVHFISLEYYLYWQFPLLNRVVHFAGGVWVALAGVWLLSSVGFRLRLHTMIGIVIAVGVAWEIFEILIGMTKEVDYAYDTMMDLVMDTAGGICGFLYAKRMLGLMSHGEETHSS